MYGITQEQKAPWETEVRYNKSSHEKCDQIKLSHTNIPIHRGLFITRPQSANQTTFKHIQTHPNSIRYAEHFYKTKNTKTEGTRKTTMQSTPLPSQHQTSLPQCTFLHTPHT